MGSKRKSQLFYTEVRWFSRGKVLTRIFELRNELKIFSKNRNNTFLTFFQDNETLLFLAYLSDIFKNLGIWIIRLEKRNFDSFDLTSNYIEKNVNLKSPILDRVLDTMKTHLRELKIQLLEYFSFNDNDFSNRWVLNPFDENIVAVAKLPIETHNQLIELSANKTLQLQFASQDLNKFWIARKNEYGSLVTEALKILIPFATSYLYEKGFSSMMAIKTKYRNRLLSLKNNLLLCVSDVEPQIKQLLNVKQIQRSH